MAEGALGTGYQLTETYEGGATGTFWIFVARDEAGVLTITEQKEAPT